MNLKFSVGDLTIHRIIEQETTFLPALEMLPGLTPGVLAENRSWMREASAIDVSDVLILCFQSYIVKTPHHTILVDSCIDAVVSGDLMHSPLQARHPELSAKFDVDQAQAATTRRNFLERYGDTDTLCCTAHFPSPSTGKIRRWGSGFSCEAVS